MLGKFDNWFYGKLLLFGEYSVLMDSMALSVPCHMFKARLVFESKEKNAVSRNSNYHLQVYLGYLKSNSNYFKPILDLAKLENDIQAGLYFDSSIPIGYGLGSSGALCAALYMAYGMNRQKEELDLFTLNNTLASMEGGFHGRSSGLDPLISYLNKPILVSEEKEIRVLDAQFDEFNREVVIILIDSKQKGDTAPLVTAFLDHCKNLEYKKQITEKLVPVTNQCIKSFSNNNMNSFFQAIQVLSNFQYIHFADKIPNGFKELWKTGLDSNKFYLKLCGSGGGGFLLCFSNNNSETLLFLNKMGYSYQSVVLNLKI
ncbi:mevalonate kinase family protein [Marinifilum sp.]|uniref:mevalonate kinase family protein n=1 Tax=Marinifilum sp. TaxID=2033137 RepID=UPI003BAA8D0C